MAHQHAMDFGTICKFFGETIFSEEYRTNFSDLDLIQQQRSPPILRYRIDYDNTSAARKDVELSIKRRIEELMQRSKYFRSGWRTMERLENDLVLNISGFVKAL
jgi:hypothetical protein